MKPSSLRPETMQRLRAACAAMGLSNPDALVERLLEVAAPAVDRQLARARRAAEEAEDLL